MDTQNINQDKNEHKGKEENSLKNSKIFSYSIIAAIVIVLNLFFNYTLDLVYPKPVYENFCSQDISNRNFDNKDQCIYNGGSWSENTIPVQELKSSTYKSEVTGYCNVTYTCQKDYDLKNNIYKRNVFIMLVILGIIAILLGAFTHIALLSVSLSWGGVVSLLIATMMYWSDANNIIKVSILALALSALIILVIKKFNDK